MTKGFKIVLKANILKKMLTALHQVDDETIMKVKPEGIEARMSGSEHVCLVGIDISPKACETYEVNESEFGLDIDKMMHLMTLANSDDLVSLILTKDNILQVNFGPFKREMPLIDQQHLHYPQIPNVAFKAKAITKASFIHKAIKASQQIGRTIDFIAKKEQFILSSEDKSDKMNMILTAGENGELETYDAEEEGKSTFSIEMFEKTVKATTAECDVTIRMASDHPISIDYGFEDNLLKVYYLVAPWVDTD